MNNRIYKFRAWDNVNNTMISVDRLTTEQSGELIFRHNVSKEGMQNLQLPLMQFTGLLDKEGLAEVYEGDIIDSEGKIKGNIYESPQIYKEGIDCLIEGMGTKIWRNTESVAMGRGCKYAE